jgi:hypothetical protein
MLDYISNRLLRKKKKSDPTAPKGSFFLPLFSFSVFLRRVLCSIVYMNIFDKINIKVNEIRRLVRGPVIDDCTKWRPRTKMEVPLMFKQI